jgi:hypothetical protein
MDHPDRNPATRTRIILLQSSFNYLSAAGRTANASILDDSMFIESFPIESSEEELPVGSGEGTDRERQKSITVGASSPMKLKAQTILGTSTRYDSATSQHDPMPSVPPTQRRGCRNEWKRRAHR